MVSALSQWMGAKLAKTSQAHSALFAAGPVGRTEGWRDSSRAQGTMLSRVRSWWTQLLPQTCARGQTLGAQGPTQRPRTEQAAGQAATDTWARAVGSAPGITASLASRDCRAGTASGGGA